MGKSQTKKKTAGRRHNPMRVPDAHLGQGKVVDGAKEQQMMPVLKKVSPHKLGLTGSSVQPSMPIGHGPVQPCAT